MEPELMDDPGIDPVDHQRALRGLARLNALSMIQRTVRREIERLSGGQPCSVLDVAAGSGDLAVALTRRSSGTRSGHTFTCCDVSPTACQAVRDRARSARVRVDAVVADIIHDGVPGEHDIVTCHLFLHHLTDEEIVSVLGSMRSAARRAVLVTDLDRTCAGYALAYLASRACTRSRVVRTDALRSVRAALRPDELRDLAQSSGMHGAVLRRVWPERMMLVWERGS